MSKHWKSLEQFAREEYGGDTIQATLAILAGVNMTPEEQQRLRGLVPSSTRVEALLVHLGAMLAEVHWRVQDLQTVLAPYRKGEGGPGGGAQEAPLPEIAVEDATGEPYV